MIKYLRNPHSITCGSCIPTSKLITRYLFHNDGESKFKQEFYNRHIPVSEIQRTILKIGSSVMSLIDPIRADMIATMGETTGVTATKFMLNRMRNDAEGIRILRDKPRINSVTIDLKKLGRLPNGTLGRAYFNFLIKNNISPDSRDMVKFVKDIELAYVMQRYREIHDLFHTVLNMPTNMLGEVTVKWIEAYQTRLPLCVFGGLFGAIRLSPKQRKKYVNYYLPWALNTATNSKFLMNIYFEERWEQSMENLLNELNISPLILPV